MVLWTVQHPSVLERLQRDGVYRCDGSNLCFPPEEDDALTHCHHAYQWIAQMMKERIGPPPAGTAYPVWAWYKRQGRADGKPDLRSYARERTEPAVRMKLDVPDWEVLLSDFDSWHFALNYWYLPSRAADEDAFDGWRASLGIAFHDVSDWSKDSPEVREVRAKVEESWKRMLGAPKPDDEKNGLIWRLRSFQATFWEIRLDQVLSVERFGC